jgi:hypothetical protein
MKTGMTRMSTYPLFYFLIELLLRLELIILHSNLFMDYTHWYLSEYLLPSKLWQNHDPTPIRVLNNWLSKLEKLQENQFITQDLIASNEWNWSLWFQNWYIEPKYQFGNFVFYFQGLSKHITLSFKDDGLDHIGSNIVYQTI